MPGEQCFQNALGLAEDHDLSHKPACRLCLVPYLLYCRAQLQVHGPWDYVWNREGPLRKRMRKKY